jgi:hypothetical protein
MAARFDTVVSVAGLARKADSGTDDYSGDVY